MFKKSNNKISEKEIINSSNIIGKETTIEGNLNTQGNIRIEGKLFGNIITKNKAIFGKNAYLEGKLNAQNAEISGTVKGVIEIKELLILKSTAIVNGDIFAKKIVFEQDAIFNGKCVMDENIKIDFSRSQNKQDVKLKKNIYNKETEKVLS